MTATTPQLFFGTNAYIIIGYVDLILVLKIDVKCVHLWASRRGRGIKEYYWGPNPMFRSEETKPPPERIILYNTLAGLLQQKSY